MSAASIDIFCWAVKCTHCYPLNILFTWANQSTSQPNSQWHASTACFFLFLFCFIIYCPFNPMWFCYLHCICIHCLPTWNCDQSFSSTCILQYRVKSGALNLEVMISLFIFALVYWQKLKPVVLNSCTVVYLYRLPVLHTEKIVNIVSKKGGNLESYISDGQLKCCKHCLLWMRKRNGEKAIDVDNEDNSISSSDSEKRIGQTLIWLFASLALFLFPFHHLSLFCASATALIALVIEWLSVQLAESAWTGIDRLEKPLVVCYFSFSLSSSTFLFTSAPTSLLPLLLVHFSAWS